MQRQLLFDNFKLNHSSESNGAVNVASVPQRSPFRYPGGKTWFIPTLRKWLQAKRIKPALFIEPFAGGGIVSLTVAFENLADKVLMVEIDERVAAVWQTIFNGDAQWLAKRILNFDLNNESLAAELEREYSDCKYVAFQTILKNRTFHGGILAEGSGIIKFGENGKGVLSRWYPATLAKRIENINFIIKKIKFIKANGLEVIKKYAFCENKAFFIDPPYTAGGKRAGARLYKYSELNHKELFDLCGSIKGDFVMTYDNAAEVIALTNRFKFDVRPISMKNTHHAEMTELIIGKDLSWMK